MEYWDLYDKDRNKLEKVGIRGERLTDDEYHLVVNAWIKNSNNQFLITRRAPNKKHPLLWESTGGSALKGESSLQAACREIKEEIGIEINLDTAVFMGSALRYFEGCPDILDCWLFEGDYELDDVTIQKEEVCDVKWATIDEIKKLIANNEFETTTLSEKVFDFIKSK